MEGTTRVSRPICFIDFETGGTDVTIHSPLEMGVVAVVNDEVVDKLRMILRVSPLVVEQEAIRINKSDLLEEGVTEYSQAATIYRNFMIKNFYKINGVFQKPNKDNMPFFGGHNTQFDRPFLCKIMNSDFDYCYYHVIDTMVIANMMRDAGRLPGVENMKLETLSKYFNLPAPARFHDASEDAMQTFHLYKALKGLLK